MEIPSREIHSDVLERISGYEIYSEEGRGLLYETKTLERILTDPEDYTNESVKFLLKELYKKVKKHKFFKIV